MEGHYTGIESHEGLNPKAVPRMARLMAFAIVFEEWLAEGTVRDYAELAVITGFDRSRITRIMNLQLLDPRKPLGESSPGAGRASKACVLISSSNPFPVYHRLRMR
jgi:hypothetical protein